MSISSERLTTYLSLSGGDLDAALALYERNMRLSEAFYVPLQCMEICFRNRLCLQLAEQYGDDWPTNNKVPFRADSADAIADGLDAIKNPSPRTGDVVEELNLGFWVGLIGPRYDSTLWRTTLHRAFRVGGRRSRSVVHGRFNALRRFRNRIAHHEPIFVRNLNRTHDEIIEAIGWMCADTSRWAAHHSRAPAILAA